MIALLHDDEVRAPAPGWFRLLVAPEHLVAPGDVRGLAAAIGALVRGEVNYPALSAAAQTRHAERFSAETMARATADVYDAVLGIERNN